MQGLCAVMRVYDYVSNSFLSPVAYYRLGKQKNQTKVQKNSIEWKIIQI